MVGQEQWQILLTSNAAEIKQQIKGLKEELSTLQNEKHSIQFDFDAEKIEKSISKIEKIFKSLSDDTKVGTGFKNLEELFRKVTDNVTTLKNGLSQINISGTDGILRDIDQINTKVLSLKNNLKDIGVNFSNFETTKSRKSSTPRKTPSPTVSEWNNNIREIKEYETAVTKLNSLRSKGFSGKNDLSKEISNQEALVKKLEDGADKARSKLSGMYSTILQKGNVSTSTLSKMSAEMDKFGTKGTASTTKVEDKISSLKKIAESFSTKYNRLNSKSPQSDKYQSLLSEYKKKSDEFKNLTGNISKKWDNEKIVSVEDIERVRTLQVELKECSQAITSMKASESGASPVGASKIFKQIAELKQFSGMSKETKAELDALERKFKASGSNFNLSDAQRELNEFKTKLITTGQTTKSFTDKLKGSLSSNFFSQMGAYFSFNDIVNGARQGIQTVRNLDTALTEMRKVSDESESSLKRYQKTTFDVASQVGTTALTIQNSTAIWMRLGESIQEAAKSAQASSILLNVSEFDNIDEATDSLVSMSKAYKDLDKMDIIDKLNNIGNKYSIATDGLATALQDSASALTTAGNNMDKSVALITAGNEITQDPSKVGAGLRTIALRLSGTEADKEKLREMGEDVEDIPIRSKLRNTIRVATADATADGQGFDIYDANGNYKDTYEIMLGLAELYDTIQQKDKELGTNNLNLLLESIAGKNRANIAASILQNPETLRSVYEDSQNSEGSAEEENQKFKDSIEGKIQELQNRVQEFWQTLISSDTIKDVTDFLTTALKTVTKITDTIGTIPSIVAAIGITKLVKGAGRGKKFPLIKSARYNKALYTKCKVFILSSVKYTVEFADMKLLCI